MRPERKLLRGVGLLTGALVLLALHAPSASQTLATSGNLVDQLGSLDIIPEIDVAALRQQASERVKAKADAAPLRRPLIAPQLIKLPQFRFDVLFDPDSSLIRPDSYRTIGRIADALYDLKLLPYTFLIVDHTDASGRRDANLILSQRRADSIRDVLVATFKVSPKRLQALGLGEEQLQDAVRPTSAVNVRAQIVTIANMP